MCYWIGESPPLVSGDCDVHVGEQPAGFGAKYESRVAAEQEERR